MSSRYCRDRTALARVDESRGRRRVLRYIRETGLREYRDTPGNRGAWILRREDGDRVEFVTLSFWDSMDASASRPQQRL
jgi:hypothetical protein